VKTNQQEKWPQACTEHIVSSSSSRTETQTKTERDGFSEVDADGFLRILIHSLLKLD
jgi:hypothetical protein